MKSIVFLVLTSLLAILSVAAPILPAAVGSVDPVAVATISASLSASAVAACHRRPLHGDGEAVENPAAVSAACLFHDPPHLHGDGYHGAGVNGPSTSTTAITSAATAVAVPRDEAAAAWHWPFHPFDPDETLEDNYVNCVHGKGRNCERFKAKTTTATVIATATVTATVTAADISATAVVVPREEAATALHWPWHPFDPSERLEDANDGKHVATTTTTTVVGRDEADGTWNPFHRHSHAPEAPHDEGFCDQEHQHDDDDQDDDLEGGHASEHLKA